MSALTSTSFWITTPPCQDEQFPKPLNGAHAEHLTKGNSAAPKPRILRVRVPSARISQSVLKSYPTSEGGESSYESSEVKSRRPRAKARGRIHTVGKRYHQAVQLCLANWSPA